MANAFVQLEPDDTGKQVQSFQNSIGGHTVEACAVVAVDSTGSGNSYVQVAPDSTGKQIQHFQNSIGGNEVHALAVVLVDTSGSPI